MLPLSASLIRKYILPIVNFCLNCVCHSCSYALNLTGSNGVFALIQHKDEISAWQQTGNTVQLMYSADGIHCIVLIAVLNALFLENRMSRARTLAYLAQVALTHSGDRTCQDEEMKCNIVKIVFRYYI